MRHAPSRETFAWLVVIVVPLGKASVEPSRAFQVPAVRVLPETCATVAARLTVPESAAMVPLLVSIPLTRIVDVPVPAVFSITPELLISVSPPS